MGYFKSCERVFWCELRSKSYGLAAVRPRPQNFQMMRRDGENVFREHKVAAEPFFSTRPESMSNCGCWNLLGVQSEGGGHRKPPLESCRQSSFSRFCENTSF